MDLVFNLIIAVEISQYKEGTIGLSYIGHQADSERG